MSRMFDQRIAAMEILMVLDKNRVPIHAVDDVFAAVKEEMVLQPVTIGATGFPPKESKRRLSKTQRKVSQRKAQHKS